MMIGMGVGVTLPSGSGLDAKMAALFAGGQQGAWYDPSDLSTLFQDSAGITPVTTTGQPIGRQLDKSGRGNHLLQATAGSRPLLQVDGGGRYRDTFDGVDDFMASTTGGAGTTGFFVCAALDYAVAGTDMDIFGDGVVLTKAGYTVRRTAANALVLFGANGTAFINASRPAPSINTKFLLTAWHDGANLNLQVDSGTVTSTAHVTTLAGQTSFTIGKDAETATKFWNGNIYALVYAQNSGLTASQRAMVQAYVRNEAGL